ncbi:MAG: EAL domain-containing protein [Desulfuromonadales bacterium]|nr:EAL domain-containing protein [Desulfuromonadales bacterium]
METVRVLLVDDDEDDYIITRDLLAETRGKGFLLDWVADSAAALREMAHQSHDAYLLDYHLGGENGLELLQQAIRDGHQGPFILLTGQGDRQTDLEAMRCGAADFLVKSQLSAPLLERSIRYAIERGRVEQKLAQMAQYDHLTGLPNRQLLEDRLGQGIALAERENLPLGVLFLDLDRFKMINDTLGHAAGDAVLKAAAERLTRSLRRSDTVARLGGDEFVVVLPHLAEVRHAAMLASRITEAFAPPICHSGHEIPISASIGIAIFPLDGQSPEELITGADAAMYKAKADGGNGFRFHSPDLNVQASQRLALENNLRRALERQEFELFYQPQFHLADLSLAAVEVLLRWQPAIGAAVEPATLLPLLEETGTIIPVGAWVLQHACRQARSWQTGHHPSTRVVFKLSGRQLRQPELVEMISASLRQAEFDPTSLELELTETVMMQQPQETADLLRRLKRLGITVAMDGFGTDSSRLAPLRLFPLDRLKLDSSLIAGIGRDPGDEALIRAVIEMAGSLGLEVVAEGVAREEQLIFLRRHGCHGAQGSLFAPPVPASQAAGFLRFGPPHLPPKELLSTLR